MAFRQEKSVVQAKRAGIHQNILATMMHLKFSISRIKGNIFGFRNERNN